MSLNIHRRVLRRAVFSQIAALLMMAGCAGGGPETLDLSPQVPALGKARKTRHSISSLVVSTPTWLDVNLGSGDDGTVVRPSGYTLYDDRGHKLKYVRNYLGALDSEPTTLELEPGRYLILLEKPERHPPIFWVAVEPGKLTEVNLLK